MIPLVLTEDATGQIAIGIRQPSYMDYFKLVAHTGATLTVPTGAKHVLFSCTTNFFVRYVDTVMTSAVYAATSTGGTAFELNPELRSLKSVTGLSIIAPSAGDLSLSFFG